MESATLHTVPPGWGAGLASIADAFDAVSAVAAIPAVATVATVAEDSRSRRWALLYRDRIVEAWAIAWPSGSGLDLHDHDGSAAGVRLVAGRLRERFVDGDALTVRWWNEGDRHDLPGSHVHEVLNVDADEAVSIHVYSPPLGDIRFREEF